MACIPEYIIKGVSTLLAPYVPTLGEPETLRLLIGQAVAMRKKQHDGLLTVSEYAKLSGQNPSTLRSKIRLTGLQPARQTPCPGGMMNLYNPEELQQL